MECTPGTTEVNIDTKKTVMGTALSFSRENTPASTGGGIFVLCVECRVLSMVSTSVFSVTMFVLWLLHVQHKAAISTMHAIHRFIFFSFL